MSSIAGSYSQVAPFKRWLVGAGGGLIYNNLGASGKAVAAGAVLADMGKTAYPSAGVVLRKVRVLPLSATNIPYVTGYIYISDTVPGAQNVVSLN